MEHSALYAFVLRSPCRLGKACCEACPSRLVIVVVTLTRMIKSVATEQAPVTLELRTTPGKKHKPRVVHAYMVHSFQNRQIYPLEGFIVSTHKLSCPTSPTPPPAPHPRSLLIKTKPLRPSKLSPSLTGYSTDRIYLIN